MKDLSITQQYFICAVNRKGTLSEFHTEKLVCFIAAGLLEMQLDACISIDKKLVRVTGDLPAGKGCLKPLYDFINQPQAVKIEKILEAYSFSISNKRLYGLIQSVGASLVGMGIAEEAKAGIFGNKTSYTPKTEAINSVVDMMRAEFFEDGEISQEAAALAILLEKSNNLKPYFSDFERKEMKPKLKRLLDTPDGRIVKSMVEYIETLTAIIAINAAH